MPIVDGMENPDLVVGPHGLPRWNMPEWRRHGFHNLHRLARYASSFRAARVLALERRPDRHIAALEDVDRLTRQPGFSAMVVVRHQQILFERYAPDFGPDCVHSIQSITKTMMHLIVGRLVEDGVIALDRTAADYIPEIGSGYRTATVRQILNMDVVNAYSEDFSDPSSVYFEHEAAMGWRLAPNDRDIPTQHEFLAGITGDGQGNPDRRVQYKCANTDLLAWIVERASGLPMRAFLAELADAAGLAGTLHMTTDRAGSPSMGGGASLTALDLARYFSLFVTGGEGLAGQRVGSRAFLTETLKGGLNMAYPYDDLRYSNHLMVSGTTIGHGGWGGQYALANLETGTVAVYFSVLENAHGIGGDLMPPLIAMLRRTTAAPA